MTSWKNYIENLFTDNRLESPPHLNNIDSLPITVDEVTKTISQLKYGKAPGLDGTHSEFVKLLDADGIGQLTRVFNNIFSTGVIPKFG